MVFKPSRTISRFLIRTYNEDMHGVSTAFEKPKRTNDDEHVEKGGGGGGSQQQIVHLW